MVPADSQWWGDTVGEHFPDGAPEDLDALGFEQDAMDWQVSRLSSGESSALPCCVAWPTGRGRCCSTSRPPISTW